MCGLFGWNLETKIPKRKKRQMHRLVTGLLVQNATRGDDSWGYYSPMDDKRTIGLGDISLMSNKSLAYLLQSPIIIGHTRKATTGAVSTDNCHPFRIGSLIGAHNGMVFNHSELNDKYTRACSVDSEHLFYHLSEGRELTDIVAYGAITYHDKCSEFPIELAVFNDGDLAICEIKDVGVIWSSNKDHLERAVALAGWNTDRLCEPYENLIYSIESKGCDLQKEISVGEPKWQTTYQKYQSVNATSGNSTCYNDYEYPLSGYLEDEPGDMSYLGVD